MTLHPFLQIQIGDVDITTIPPEFVQSLTYKSSIEALSTLDFNVVDPTFSDIEQLLIGSDSDNSPIFARFGYTDRFGQTSSNWIQTRLISYSPRLTHKGTDITASCLVDVGNQIVEARSRVYQGRISSVVQQIADDIGITAEVEETNDDINDALPDNRGAPKLWCTNGLTTYEFVRKILLPLARSRTGQSDYQFWITGVGSRTQPPVLHFHTKEFPNCSTRKKRIKELTYLAGQQDQVIDFQPNYNSSLLGNLGGGQTVMRAYDPVTKQFVSSVQNFRTNKDSLAYGSGQSSVSQPITEEGVNEDLASQAGFHMVREDSTADAEARARNRWELLKAYSFTAVLTLVGLPDYPDAAGRFIPGTGTTDLEANDQVQMNVLIPNLPGSSIGPPYRKHWSSGLYLVTEAVHEISSQYTVTCQLRRDQSDLGGGPSKGAKFIPQQQQ